MSISFTYTHTHRLLLVYYRRPGAVYKEQKSISEREPVERGEDLAESRERGRGRGRGRGGERGRERLVTATQYSGKR